MGQYLGRTDPNPAVITQPQEKGEFKTDLNKGETNSCTVSPEKKELEFQVEAPTEKETESQVEAPTEKETEFQVKAHTMFSETKEAVVETIPPEDLILGAATYLQTMPFEKKAKLENHLLVINYNTGFSSECKCLVPTWPEVLGEEVTRLSQFIVAKRTHEREELETRLRRLCAEKNSKEFNILLNILYSSYIGGPS